MRQYVLSRYHRKNIINNNNNDNDNKLTKRKELVTKAPTKVVFHGESCSVAIYRKAEQEEAHASR